MPTGRRVPTTRRVARSIGLMAAAALASGCMVTVGHVASITPVQTTGRTAPAPGRRVEGRDCVPIIIVAPIGYPHLDHATERALRGGGRSLSDVTIRYELRYLPCLFGHGCYMVEATAS